MMPKLKQTVQHDDAQMIFDPDRWPAWPYLPIKRGNNKLAEGNLGIIWVGGGQYKFNDATGKPEMVMPVRVYGAYLFDLPKDAEAFKATKSHEYPTVGALLADGWMVD